ncbi:DUF2306 domain-containing protein [Pseudoalteromonas sp. SMS1]|uniref:DUF2306 domain-containing protein n=1 Tax=Pseudoalteromonas sp. SMS1 TaxID=2908894 RepID=UPI001F3302BE|nr:DUF2306 domain-containing protein [Pseudoalteromonas sp. SMS1]MCF2858518.1 DUF2306 domain-containing protein [Pseudoalteromonas sp. SMS1]
MTAPLQHTKQGIKFNWPAVISLLILTAIPGIPAIIIVILVLLGSGAVAGVSEAINAQYFLTPAAILTHGIAGGLFFLTMPWQFSDRIRAYHLRWHQITGRVAVMSGCVMALSGVWMHLMLSPHDLGSRFMSLIILSVAICGAFIVAVVQVIKGRIEQHRAWMMRAVALALAAITPIFTGAVLQLVFSAWTGGSEILAALHHDYDRLIAMAVNLVVVEWMLRTKLRSARENSVLAQ